MSITGEEKLFHPVAPVYVGVPEVAKRWENRAADRRDFNRMRDVLRLRESMRRMDDTAVWARQELRVSQLRSGLTYPKAGVL